MQDLMHVDRKVTPWVVMNMHRPIYTSSTSGVGPSSVIRTASDLRDALEPLLILYQVSMPIFSAHVKLCFLSMHASEPLPPHALIHHPHCG
jgi:hypothetical protein